MANYNAPWNKGIKMTEEQKKNMYVKHPNYPAHREITLDTRYKMSLAKQGKHWHEEDGRRVWTD